MRSSLVYKSIVRESVSYLYTTDYTVKTHKFTIYTTKPCTFYKAETFPQWLKTSKKLILSDAILTI